MSGLATNIRQDSFINNLVEGMSNTDAYSQAYKLQDRNCCSVGANKLLKKKKIVSILQNRLSEKHKMYHQREIEMLNSLTPNNENIALVIQTKGKIIKRKLSLINA